MEGSGEDEMTALEWKAKGNELYKSRDYKASIAAYSEAIRMDGKEPAFRLNRAAAYLMTLEYKQCVTDCDAAIALDAAQSKAYFRKATALRSMGRVDAAIEALQTGLVRDPTNKEGIKQRDVLRGMKDKITEAREQQNNGYGRRALVILNELVAEVGTNMRDVNLLKIEVLLGLQRPEEAINLSNAMMRAGMSGDVDLLMLRASCLYSTGDLDNAVKHLQQAMRSDPDNSTARKELKRVREVADVKKAGADAYRAGDSDTAIERWSHCLTLDPNNKMINSRLYCNRATALATKKSPDHAAAIKDCDKAIYMDTSYQKAYLRRADCYMALNGDDEKGEITKAIEDYEKVAELMEEASDSIKDKLKKAKVALKRAGRKNYYKILGVGNGATDAEIKKSYKKMALRFHPDRMTGKSEAEKEAATAKFKDIGEAYEVLTDAEKKRKYDSGVDPEDLDNPHAGMGGHSHGGMGGI